MLQQLAYKITEMFLLLLHSIEAFKLYGKNIAWCYFENFYLVKMRKSYPILKSPTTEEPVTVLQYKDSLTLNYFCLKHGE